MTVQIQTKHTNMQLRHSSAGWLPGGCAEISKGEPSWKQPTSPAMIAN